MNPLKAGYWIVTALAALPMAASGVLTFTHAPDMVGNLDHLGFDTNFMTILGLWKVLGAATILWRPGPVVTEWAYAGIFFTLTGASWSHFAVGDGVGGVIAPLVILAFAMLSRGMAFLRNA
jgi:hypothetical protein